MKTENKKIDVEDELLNKIHHACLNRNFTTIRELVEKVVDMDNILRLCAQYGALDSVRYLVEKGADISANDYSSVNWAAFENKLEVVQYFIIEKNIDIDHVLKCKDADPDIIKWAKEHKEKIDFNNKINNELAVEKKIESRMKI